MELRLINRRTENLTPDDFQLIDACLVEAGQRPADYTAILFPPTIEYLGEAQLASLPFHYVEFDAAQHVGLFTNVTSASNWDEANKWNWPDVGSNYYVIVLPIAVYTHDREWQDDDLYVMMGGFRLGVPDPSDIHGRLV